MMATSGGLYRALLLLLLAAAAAGSWLDGDDGVDRANGDLADMPMKMNASASPSGCAGLCEAESKCVAWVYSKPSCKGQGTSYPLCYLKAAVMQQSSNPCRVGRVYPCPSLVSKTECVYSNNGSCRCPV